MSTSRSVLAAAVGFLLLAPAASAQPPPKELPTGEVDGVRVKRTARDGIVVTFTDEAARLYRRIAGRRVIVSCGKLGSPQLVLGRELIEQSEALVAPRRRAPLRTGMRTRGFDFCSVARARGPADEAGTLVTVSITQDGAVYLDEQAVGENLVTALGLATRDQRTFLPANEIVQRVGDRFPVVALAAPTDSPPAGRIGIFSDGAKHAAAVGLSTLGRRLFFEVNGDTVATNTLYSP
jgi:hypothetical protein